MKKLKILLASIFICLVIIPAFTLVTYANSAEPPCFTVIVSFPVEDFNLSIRYSNGDESEPIILKKEQKAWETYYRFFYHMSGDSRVSFHDATLVVNSSEKSFECPLPTSALKQYNNILTLDIENEKLLVGKVPFRAPLLVTMRVILTLIIEGLIFFLFGYRKKTSWITFICINLITQGALNISLNGPYLNGYWFFGFVFAEIIIFIFEAIAFASILKEHNKPKAVTYAFASNLISLILGGLIISYLPI